MSNFQKNSGGYPPTFKNEHVLDVRMNTTREDAHIEKERIYLLKKSYLQTIAPVYNAAKSFEYIT